MLLAAGLAQELYASAPSRGPVIICDCDGRPRWREEWLHHPAIHQPNQPSSPDTPTLRIGPRCSPYHPWSRDLTFRARDHPRGTVYLTTAEQQLGASVQARYGRYLLIEPTGNDRKNRNRVWPGWAELAFLLAHCLPADLTLVQLDRLAADRLPGIPGVPHTSFRQACAVVASAHLLVTTEGGLAIAAAGLGAPAIVLWGSANSPLTAGYPEHVNLVDDSPHAPHISSSPCAECAAAWARLTPEHVAGVVCATLHDMRTRVLVDPMTAPPAA